MDAYSSGGEDLLVKTRKPYTITKQRERWSEEEHNRFLEALKLYGRAWQRIEEHIGSKTAVQIRSHAQKFFTKLEKEALVKGVPIGQAHDIAIPPPRPKRKPSNPYPRKTAIGTPSSQAVAKDGKSSSVSSFSSCKQVLDLGREPFSEKSSGDERAQIANGSQNENNDSEVLNLFHEAPCTSMSSANKRSMSIPLATRSSCPLKEFVPLRGKHCSNIANECQVLVKSEGKLKVVKHDQKLHYNLTNKTSDLEMPDPSLEEVFRSEKIVEITRPEKYGDLEPNDMQAATQNYPRDTPVHVLNGSLGMNTENVPLEMQYQETMPNQLGGIHGHPNLFSNSAASRSSLFTPPPYPLFNPLFNNQDDYQSHLQVSSSFSTLIVSTLLQNPAAHAAASYAASFWQCANMADSADSLLRRGFPSSGQIPSSAAPPHPPTMAAIAAATVAAATAWWTAHGLLSFCSSSTNTTATTLHNDFNCTPEPVAVGNHVHRMHNAFQDDLPFPNQQQQQLDVECSVSLQEHQQSTPELPSLSPLDSEQSKGAKEDAKSSATASNEEAAAVATEPHDSNMAKNLKQVDRSSCGSNTASSSEVETDALPKIEKSTEEPQEKPDASHVAGDSNNRRSRSSSSTSDSWKEVSEEGRIAFQALFSREVLPQSFSPPHDLKNKGNQINIENDQQNKDNKVEEDALELVLSSKTWGTCSSYQVMEKNTSFRSENSGKMLLLPIDIGQGKLKARRTGFKPYKRCSVEAKESMVGSAWNQGEEKGPKRIRLEGEAST